MLLAFCFFFSINPDFFSFVGKTAILFCYECWCVCYRLRNRSTIRDSLSLCQNVWSRATCSLKSFTNSQNWHDILRRHYVKHKQHIKVKENGKDENYATPKDTETFQSQSISSCSRNPLTVWVSFLTSVCCSFWCMATTSSQGFNLRKKEKKDVSKDEKPLDNYRRRTKYKVNVCLQDVFCFQFDYSFENEEGTNRFSCGLRPGSQCAVFGGRCIPTTNQMFKFIIEFHYKVHFSICTARSQQQLVEASSGQIVYTRENKQRKLRWSIVFYKRTDVRITSVQSIQSTKIRKYHLKSGQYKVQI